MITQRKKRTLNPLIAEGKIRMNKVRQAYSGNYTQATIEHFPELNSAKGIDIIRNAWLSKAYYPELIDFWENLSGVKKPEVA